MFGGAGTSLPADAAWFNFTTTGGPFAVYEFHGLEEVHKPYEFSVELVSTSSAVDITGLVGQAGCLTIIDRSGETRPVHGIICRMEQLHTANRYTHYRCIPYPGSGSWTRSSTTVSSRTKRWAKS
jgi:type VI secretion system secreted protein VgrG